MRRHLLALLALAWAASRVESQEIAPSPERLAAILRSSQAAADSFAPILEGAQNALGTPPCPVAVIVSEGHLKSDPEKEKSLRSLRDMEKIAALGPAAGAILRRPEYSAKAREFILAWAGTTHSTGDSINDTKLEPVFVAYDLLRSEFSERERATVEGWLREIIARETTIHPLIRAKHNNSLSHRLKVIGLCAFVLKDETEIAHVASLFEAQIGADLLPDGSSFDFHERDALHYHCFTLEPMLRLALAFRGHGHDFYRLAGANGASLEKSVKFLVPYCMGQESHREFVQSRNAFDRARGGAGEVGYVAGRLFDPREGLPVIELASAFDPSLLPLVAKLAGRP